MTSPNDEELFTVLRRSDRKWTWKDHEYIHTFDWMPPIHGHPDYPYCLVIKGVVKYSSIAIVLRSRNFEHKIVSGEESLPFPVSRQN